MDVSDPTSAITSTLDGPVLAVLATAGRPLSVGQIAQLSARGSEIGVRRSLGRLIDQGIVRATLMGRNQVHELNREHIAADIALELANLRPKLWQLLRDALASWRPRPMYAAVFGSAARGDGDGASDIDLLIVHPVFPNERRPPRLDATVLEALVDALGDELAAARDDSAVERWEAQLDDLRRAVMAWTGNHLQIVDLAFSEWRRPDRSTAALLADVESDGIQLDESRALSAALAGRKRG